MCGIAGVFQYDGKGAVDRPLLDAMRDTMTHRGPDGAGAWVSDNKTVGLAHRRLAIVDLSDSASQPMSNEDGAVWLTFNGEIYNHMSLREELQKAGHKFKSDHSDSEALAHGYEEWGIDGLLERIDGMFAFGIWDARKRRLFIARDRVGVKPVYFHMGGGRFLFASEIKALLAHPGTPRDMDDMAMFHYLTFLATPAPMTMFKDIYKLPAGYYMTIGMGGDMKAVRYWDAVGGLGFGAAEKGAATQDELEEICVGQTRARLSSAIEKRLMSDVPHGVFLSGGVDSSTNVALMSRLCDTPIRTFTVGFKDHDELNELEYARAVAGEFKTEHHETLIDEKDMTGYLDSLIHHQDEPIADWVCVPLYFVSKLARECGVKMVQVGEGADEQFSGYDGYLAYLSAHERYWKRFQSLPAFAARAAARSLRAVSGWSPKLESYAEIAHRAVLDRDFFWSGAIAFQDLKKESLVRTEKLRACRPGMELMATGLMPEGYLEADSSNIVRSFQERLREGGGGNDYLQGMIYNEFKLRLPELLLMRVDKITMSTSLEARVPFLDQKLVEYTMDIPQSLKIRHGKAKYVLKKAVEGLVPADIIHKKKMGFSAPMRQWLMGDFGKYARNELMESYLVKEGVLDKDMVLALVDRHMSGNRDNSVGLWTLFNLAAWRKRWIG